jgi:hypothetical protein
VSVFERAAPANNHEGHDAHEGIELIWIVARDVTLVATWADTVGCTRRFLRVFMRYVTFTAALLMGTLATACVHDRPRAALAAAAPCQSAAGLMAAQSPLPSPTGRLCVGRTSMHLPAAPGGDAIELMLHVWYPAAANGRPAQYIAGWDRAQATLAEPVKRLFRDAYGEFEQGRIFSYASENTRPLDGRHPVLLFAHGLGIPTFAYTAQMEELASHGYVVAAVEYSPAAAFVLFPDGRIAAMNAEQWNALAKLPQDSPELLERERAEIEGGVRALRRAIDHLERANASGPLAGRLDLQRLGAFGHSFGAMAVLRALQVDRRLRAGMTQDALGPSVLAYAAAEGKQMTSKVALFFRPIGANNRPNVERLFKSLPSGTLLATPSSPGFAHMSFSDMLLLRAGADDAGTRASATRNLAIVRALTRTFFDSALRGSSAAPADLPSNGYRELTIEVQ